MKFSFCLPGFFLPFVTDKFVFIEEMQDLFGCPFSTKKKIERVFNFFDQANRGL